MRWSNPLQMTGQAECKWVGKSVQLLRERAKGFGGIRRNDLLPGYHFSPIWGALGHFVAHGEYHADL